MKAPRKAAEIEAMIAKIESDERYRYPPADVFSNAPLALIQVELKATVDALRWALGGKHHLDDDGPKRKGRKQ